MYRNELPIIKVHAAGVEEVDKAVAAARAAFEGPWSDVPGPTRAKLLHRFADLVEKHAETLATIESWDNGRDQNSRVLAKSTEK
jgi:aldehyde dehydrogenase (NAD(P)+)